MEKLIVPLDDDELRVSELLVFNPRLPSISLSLPFEHQAPADFERRPIRWSLLVWPIQLV